MLASNPTGSGRHGRQRRGRKEEKRETATPLKRRTGCRSCRQLWIRRGIGRWRGLVLLFAAPQSLVGYVVSHTIGTPLLPLTGVGFSLPHHSGLRGDAHVCPFPFRLLCGNANFILSFSASSTASDCPTATVICWRRGARRTADCVITSAAPAVPLAVTHDAAAAAPRRRRQGRRGGTRCGVASSSLLPSTLLPTVFLPTSFRCIGRSTQHPPFPHPSPRPTLHRHHNPYHRTRIRGIVCGVCHVQSHDAVQLLALHYKGGRIYHPPLPPPEEPRGRFSYRMFYGKFFLLSIEDPYSAIAKSISFQCDLLVFLPNK